MHIAHRPRAGTVPRPNRPAAPASLNRIPPRTVVALAALALVLGVFAVAVGPRLIGPIGADPARPAPGRAEADRDTEFLRSLSIDRLRQEHRKRAAEVNRLVNAADPPREKLGAARDAALRASGVLSEKDPGRER